MRLQNVLFNKQGDWLYNGVVSVLYSWKFQNILNFKQLFYLYYIYIIYTPVGLNYETE